VNIGSEKIINRAYLLPGMPQPLLTPEAHPGYGKLRKAYEKVREEILASDADVILIYSEMWTSVIGHQIQAMPEPSLVYVDEEFHDLGTIPYQFKIDVSLAEAYNSEAQKRGLHSRTVAYEGFPMDTGTVVALKLINPDNRIPAVILSSNIYSDSAETALLAQAGLAALEKQGKKAIAIIISNLSKNMHHQFIDPKEDHIYSSMDDARNRELLKLLEEGRLDQFIHQDHYNLKPFWWMEALMRNQGLAFSGETIEYAPVSGCGCAVVSMSQTAIGKRTPVESLNLEKKQAVTLNVQELY